MTTKNLVLTCIVSLFCINLSYAKWLQADPKAEKYYATSPYAYCLDNPVKFIDPNGDTVRIVGSERNEAFRQLQNRLEGQLSLTINGNGNIIAMPIYGVKQTSNSKLAMKIFNSTDIIINVIAENSKITSTGNLYVGGAFMGNIINRNGSITASQEVNPLVLGRMNNAYGKPGQDMLHEVTEAYQGALIAKRAGVASPMSNQANSIYQQAHDAAIPQSGIVRVTYYNNAGKIVQTLGASVVKATYSVFPKKQKPVIIMTFP